MIVLNMKKYDALNRKTINEIHLITVIIYIQTNIKIGWMADMRTTDEQNYNIFDESVERLNDNYIYFIF